jgi:hypothetical protein
MCLSGKAQNCQNNQVEIALELRHRASKIHQRPKLHKIGPGQPFWENRISSWTMQPYICEERSLAPCDQESWRMSPETHVASTEVDSRLQWWQYLENTFIHSNEGNLRKRTEIARNLRRTAFSPPHLSRFFRKDSIQISDHDSGRSECLDQSKWILEYRDFEPIALVSWASVIVALDRRPNVQNLRTHPGLEFHENEHDRENRIQPRAENWIGRIQTYLLS